MAHARRGARPPFGPGHLPLDKLVRMDFGEPCLCRIDDNTHLFEERCIAGKVSSRPKMVMRKIHMVCSNLHVEMNDVVYPFSGENITSNGLDVFEFCFFDIL